MSIGTFSNTRLRRAIAVGRLHCRALLSVIIESTSVSFLSTFTGRAVESLRGSGSLFSLTDGLLPESSISKLLLSTSASVCLRGFRRCRIGTGGGDGGWTEAVGSGSSTSMAGSGNAFSGSSLTGVSCNSPVHGTIYESSLSGGASCRRLVRKLLTVVQSLGTGRAEVDCFTVDGKFKSTWFRCMRNEACISLDWW